MHKAITALVLAGTLAASASSQNDEELTYGEFKTGYGVTQFGPGLSDRFNSGNFSTSGGGLFSIAAYRKFEGIDNLHFGIRYKAFGAFQSRGDNGEEMFFNFHGASVSAKYYPFSRSASSGLYLQGDFNFSTQFTQKYRVSEALKFDHQFAIGPSLTVGLGYHFPLKDRYAVVASVEYDWASRQGEVQGIGDKRFRNSNLALQLGLLF
jgi:hypothetical protein